MKDAISPRASTLVTPSILVTMSLKRLLPLSFGLCCYLLAVSMFFYFPGVEAWTFSAFHPIVHPSGWVCGLLVLLVVLPAVIGPTALADLARGHARIMLVSGCFGLAALFATAGSAVPLLYVRVALMALLTGQLWALGKHAKASVPFNWMIYLAFVLANFNFPDSQILAGADFLAAAYWLVAGVLLLRGKWKVERKSRFQVMVG